MTRHYDWWTIPELRRIKQLADAGMPCGSIAILLELDFGTVRTADTVRAALQRHFKWKSGRNRGNPFQAGDPRRAKVGA